MTDAAPGPAAGAPRPGSLEWLADTHGESPAVIDAGSGAILSRSRHDTAAAALARGLAAEHGITAGVRVALALPPGPELLLALYALAKLGAAPVLLPAAGAGPHAVAAARTAAAAGCRLLLAAGPVASAATGPPVLPAGALPSLIAGHADGARPLSGEQAPADSVQCSDPGDGPPRLLLRARTPEGLARLAAPVGDLLSRVALPPRGVHLLGPGADRPEPQFWASVALVTGGCVVTQPAADPALLLRALVAHEVTSVVLDVPALRALTGLPAPVREQADLTALQRVITSGPPLDPALAAAGADLFGEDVLHHVLATTQTGPFAHLPPDALAGPARPLTGVTVQRSPAGELLVRSPLTADGALGEPAARGGWPAAPAWREAAVPTGWPGSVDAAGRVSVRGASE